MKAVFLGLAAGVLSGMCLLPLALGNPGGTVLASMAPLPVFLAGLGFGIPAVVTAVLAGLSVTGGAGGIGFALAFAENTGVPALVLVPMALWAPSPPSVQRLVLGLTGLGIAVFGVVYLSLRPEPGGAQGVLQKLTSEWLEMVKQQSDVPLPPTVTVVAQSIPFWLLGGVVAFGLINVAGNAILAQAALSRFNLNRIRLPGLSSLTLPPWMSVLFVVALAGAVFGTGEVAYLGTNFAEILAVPLLFGGLAVLHTAVKGNPARLPLLIGIYLALLFVGPAILIVVVGMIEQWIGLRRRLSAPKSAGEL